MTVSPLKSAEAIALFRAHFQASMVPAEYVAFRHDITGEPTPDPSHGLELVSIAEWSMGIA